MQDEKVEELQAADVAYDVAMRRLDEQMRSVDAIDNKTAIVIGAATAVAALFAGFASTTVEPSEEASLIVGVIAIALVGLLYALAVRVAFRAYRFYEWSLRPSWRHLIDFSRTNSESLIRSWVAVNCVHSMEANAGLLDRKLADAGWAMRLLMAEGLTAVAGMIAIILATGLTS